MMENEKILLNLTNQLEALQKHISALKESTNNLHKLDIVVLQNKVRELYEKVLELNETVESKPEVHDDTDFPKIDVQEETELTEAEVKTEEKASEESNFAAEQEIEESPLIEVEFEINEETVEKDEQTPEEVAEEPFEEAAEEEIKITKSESVRSTIDLFSATREPTIFDTIAFDKEPSVADKIRQARISDLRQAIGINEKFLFINELFNGDMGKYNKVLDELNELKTQEGVVAYFIELKIHNQWNDESEAYLKFKELLDRKME